MLNVLKCLWILLSNLDVPNERYHRLQRLRSYRFCFMLSYLPEFVLLPANIILQLIFV